MMCTKQVLLSLFICEMLLCGVDLFAHEIYEPKHQYVSLGNLNIGAILTIQTSPEKKDCLMQMHHMRLLEYVEAIIFATSEINKRDDILPNITLGFVILDDCYRKSVALSRAVQMMPYYLRCNETCPALHQPDQFHGEYGAPEFFDVVGVIGAYNSALSMVISSLLGQFKIPHISHTATSDLLSDKSEYPYFLRMVPPDKFQVRVIADLLQFYNWTYVSIIYSEGSYGRGGMTSLKTLLARKDICVEKVIQLHKEFEDRDYENAIISLREDTSARVVVMFTDILQANAFTTVARRATRSGEFLWVGSDSLSLAFSDQQHEGTAHRYNMPGTITVIPYTGILREFDKHMKYVLSTGNTKNPWLRDFIAKVGYNGTSKYKVDTFSGDGGRVIDIVNAFAFALDILIKRKYSKTAAGHLKQHIYGPDLLHVLKTIRFNGSIGDISFDDNGDVLGIYEIRQCQIRDGVVSHVPIGKWDMHTQQLSMNTTEVNWGSTRPSQVPVSRCPDHCTVGNMYYFPRGRCCWECRPCKSNEITTCNFTKCEHCSEFHWPDNDTRTKCQAIEAEFICFTDIVAIVVCAVATAGFCSCGFIALIFFRYRKERIIRATSRELSHVMLLGISVAYLLVFSFVSMPTIITCYMSHIGFNLSFTLVYAPLLMKTNQIYRIFSAGKKTRSLPMCAGSSSQVVIVLLLLVAQVSAKHT